MMPESAAGPGPARGSGGGVGGLAMQDLGAQLERLLREKRHMERDLERYKLDSKHAAELKDEVASLADENEKLRLRLQQLEAAAADASTLRRRNAELEEHVKSLTARIAAQQQQQQQHQQQHVPGKQSTGGVDAGSGAGPSPRHHSQSASAAVAASDFDPIDTTPLAATMKPGEAEQPPRYQQQPQQPPPQPQQPHQQPHRPGVYDPVRERQLLQQHQQRQQQQQPYQYHAQQASPYAPIYTAGAGTPASRGAGVGGANDGVSPTSGGPSYVTRLSLNAGLQQPQAPLPPQGHSHLPRSIVKRERDDGLPPAGPAPAGTGRGLHRPEANPNASLSSERAAPRRGERAADLGQVLPTTFDAQRTARVPPYGAARDDSHRSHQLDASAATARPNRRPSPAGIDASPRTAAPRGILRQAPPVIAPSTTAGGRTPGGATSLGYRSQSNSVRGARSAQESPSPRDPIEGPDMERVFVTSMLSAAERDRVERVVARIGRRARMADVPSGAAELPREITHVVVAGEPTSAKAFLALATGRTVVTLEYIAACDSFGYWVQEGAIEGSLSCTPAFPLRERTVALRTDGMDEATVELMKAVLSAGRATIAEIRDERTFQRYLRDGGDPSLVVASGDDLKAVLEQFY